MVTFVPAFVIAGRPRVAAEVHEADARTAGIDVRDLDAMDGVRAAHAWPASRPRPWPTWSPTSARPRGRRHRPHRSGRRLRRRGHAARGSRGRRPLPARCSTRWPSRGWSEDDLAKLALGEHHAACSGEAEAVAAGLRADRGPSWHHRGARRQLRRRRGRPRERAAGGRRPQPADAERAEAGGADRVEPGRRPWPDDGGGSARTCSGRAGPAGDQPAGPGAAATARGLQHGRRRGEPTARVCCRRTARPAPTGSCSDSSTRHRDRHRGGGRDRRSGRPDFGWTFPGRWTPASPPTGPGGRCRTCRAWTRCHGRVGSRGRRGPGRAGGPCADDEFARNVIMAAGGLLPEHVPWLARAGVRDVPGSTQVRPLGLVEGVRRRRPGRDLAAADRRRDAPGRAGLTGSW